MKSFLVILIIFFPFIIYGQTRFMTNQSTDLTMSYVNFNNIGGIRYSNFLFNPLEGISSNGTNLVSCNNSNDQTLIWNNAPTVWNTSPDIVLGQPNFIGNINNNSILLCNSLLVSNRQTTNIFIYPILLLD